MQNISFVQYMLQSLMEESQRNRQVVCGSVYLSPYSSWMYCGNCIFLLGICQILIVYHNYFFFFSFFPT